MGQIYKDTDFELTIETGINLTAMATRQIIYRKPGSVVDSTFNASLVGTTQLRYNVPRSTNTTATPSGRWMFHARVIDAGGKISLGELGTLLIKSRWE